jgi:hypothetical protein
VPPAFIAITMHSKDNDVKRAICKASLAMDLDPRLKATVATREFKALYRRLLNCRKGIPRSTSRGGHNKKLREPQNTAVKSYLEMLYHCRKAANQEHLILTTNRVLYYSGLTATVSTRWAKGWMARESEFLKTLRSKPLSTKRLAAYIIEDVEGHFATFRECKEKWAIKDNDITNFDETGHQIGVCTGERVIVPVDYIAVF